MSRISKVVNICVVCGEKFITIRYRAKVNVTCSRPCLKETQRIRMLGNQQAAGQPANSGAFKSGSVPWNTGTKGVMKPNSGSFQEGRESETKEPIGSEKLRRNKDRALRWWVKIRDNGNPLDWKLRAIVVWEKVNGPLPEGCVIHHKDRNPQNDVIDNLQLMTRAEHLLEHKHEYEEKRKYAATQGAHRRKARNRTTRRPDSSSPDAIL